MRFVEGKHRVFVVKGARSLEQLQAWGKRFRIVVDEKRAVSLPNCGDAFEVNLYGDRDLKTHKYMSPAEMLSGKSVNLMRDGTYIGRLGMDTILTRRSKTMQYMVIYPAIP